MGKYHTDNPWEQRVIEYLELDFPEYFSMSVEELEEKSRNLYREGERLIDDGYSLQSQADDIEILLKYRKMGRGL